MVTWKRMTKDHVSFIYAQFLGLALSDQVSER